MTTDTTPAPATSYAEVLAALTSVHAQVLKLAEEYPQQVYKQRENVARCSYHPDTQGNPMGCIMGEAMRRAGYVLRTADGFPLEGSITGVLYQVVMGHEAVTRLGRGDTLASGVTEYEVFSWFRNAHSEWFAEVQTAQDGGKAWGQCVEDVEPWRPIAASDVMSIDKG